VKSTTQIDAEQAAKEDQLVREHLPLVQYVVSEVAHRVPNHVSRNDLVSAGMLGLAQARPELRSASAASRSTGFASTRIRGATARRAARDATGPAARLHRAPAAAGHARRADQTVWVAPQARGSRRAHSHRARNRAQARRRRSPRDRSSTTYSLVVEGDAESFIASSDDGPEKTLLDRERKAYLDGAVGALPERLRRVVIGYFFEERSMQDLADELGGERSRISQLRAEALLLLRDGVNSQLEPEALPDEPRPNGRVARRKAELLRRGRRRSDFRTRLSDRPIDGDEIVEHTARAAVGSA
jgi:RNA polymerase sigma factor for flagellar operon FliA